MMQPPRQIFAMFPRWMSQSYSSALAYYDSLASERLPASLIQAQRDFFGAHTYGRVDRPGTFHTLWSDDRSEVQM